MPSAAIRTDTAALLRQALDSLEGTRLPWPTLDDLWRLLMSDYIAQGRVTAVRAQQSFHHLRAHFGTDPLDDVTAESFRYVELRRNAGAAPASIRRDLAVLKRALHLAAQRGLISSVPHLPTVQVRNARSGYLKPGDLEALLVALPDYLRGPVAFAAITGMRRSEFSRLTWKEVDLEATVVRLGADRTKNRCARIVPFGKNQVLRRILYDAAAKRADGCAYVFHEAGRPLGDFKRAWATATKKAGLPGLLVHDLRRSAARSLLRAGVPVPTVMALLGWKSSAMLTRYAIQSETDLADALGAL